MKLSTRARYGLRGVFDIAYHNRGRATHVKDIARRQDVTPRYLEQIFQALKKAGLLTGQRGPRGGYALARAPEEITVGDVVRATEGPIRFTDDAKEGSRTRRVAGEVAPAPKAAPNLTRTVWDELAKEIEATLDGVSVADLCRRAEAEGLPRDADAKRLMYFI